VIFVDTSVWVAALRSDASPEARRLVRLLDADLVALALPVRVEILSGASVTNRVKLRRTLSSLPLFYPRESTWALIDAWVDLAGVAGEHFGFADLLIGAIAAEQGGEVWSLDSDFARMARVGLVRSHRT